MPYLKNFIDTGKYLMEEIHKLHDKNDRIGYTGMGADGTMTSRLDDLCESVIIERINDLDLPFNIVSEETGFTDRNYENNIVIDPLDGTYNAENQIPAYSISIAIMGENFDSIQEGFVMNLPTMNYFWAEKGKGAFRNEIPLHKTSKLTGASVVYSLEDDIIPEFLKTGINRRRILGCASVEMSLLSNGSLDFVAYLGPEKKLRNVDIAAGIILVRETGGIVLDEHFKPLNMDLDVRKRKNMIALSAARLELLGGDNN